MGLFKSIFTWWDGPTLGTRLWTRLHGVEAGRDAQGNRYFRGRKDRRRWVIYNGENEASRVPPEWRNWLHGTAELTPAEARPARKLWEKPHHPNLSGTPEAWRRPGTLAAAMPRERASGDYEAWTPD